MPKLSVTAAFAKMFLCSAAGLYAVCVPVLLTGKRGIFLQEGGKQKGRRARDDCGAQFLVFCLDMNLEEDALSELAAEVRGAVEITSPIQHEIAE
jgi:hypothetical protein